MKLNNFLKLIIAILIAESAGIIGSIFTMKSLTIWYANLQKSTINPPNWVFAPVWTSLFILIGISLFLVWSYDPTWNQNKKFIKKIALIIFGIQLVLNTFWPIIFFGFHSPLYAFIEIIILWLAILINIIMFYKVSRVAAWLLLPYILWVSFAAYLNYTIFIIN